MFHSDNRYISGPSPYGYIVMANVVIASIFRTCIGLHSYDGLCTYDTSMFMAYTVVTYGVWPIWSYVVMGSISMASMLMTCIFMAYIVMAYADMSYEVADCLCG